MMNSMESINTDDDTAVQHLSHMLTMLIDDSYHQGKETAASRNTAWINKYQGV